MKTVTVVRGLTGTFKNTLILLLFCLGISACESNDVPQQTTGKTNVPLAFKVNFDGTWTENSRGGMGSRGTPTNSLQEFFALYASYYETDGEATQTMNFMQNEKAGSYENEIRTINTFTPPPIHKPMHFYAYYPYEESTAVVRHIEFTEGNISYQGVPYFSFTLNDKVKEQVDLMVADTIASTNDVLLQNHIPLRFVHLLTAVRFVVDASVPEGTLKTIAINNVANGGTYAYSTRTWQTVNTTMNNYQIEPNLVVGGERKEIAADSTFMMMPQAMGDDANIEVTINNGSDHTVKASLAGRTWQGGKVVTYNIKINKLESGKYGMSLTVKVSDWEDVAKAHYTF